jgi:mannan endo-1,4-beta-mannosidase
MNKIEFNRGASQSAFKTNSFSSPFLKIVLPAIIFSFLPLHFIFQSSAVTPNIVQGDINGDKAINITDLSILLSNYGKASGSSSDPNSDTNHDNVVNVFDLSALLSNYGKAVDTNIFITRKGADLFIGNERFRASGANMYWANWHDDGTIPSKFEISDAIETTAEMGGQSMRIFVGSFGCPQCYEPSLNTFTDANLDRLDYAVDQAKKNNIKLMFSLVDEWDYNPHWESKVNFTNWRGFTSGFSDGSGQGPSFATTENTFFTDATIRSDFKNYINHIVNHSNPYTGLAYKDDSTIYSWETGNELWNAQTVTSIASWTADIAQYIKQVAPKQLVVDGCAFNKKVDTTSLASSYVDAVDLHFYGGTDISIMQSDASTANGLGKAAIVGEYKSDWDNSTEMTPWLSAFENTGPTGADIDMFWFIRPHKDTNGFYTNRGAYPLYYPGALTNSNMRADTLSLRNHGFKMQGVTNVPPDKKPGPPLMATPTWTGTAMRVNWRGTVAADTYNIERSNDNGATWQVVKTGITDWDTPWTDPSGSATTSKYRVQGVNRSAVKGCYSTQSSC